MAPKTFDELSIRQLKHLLAAKAAQYPEKKREITLRIMEQQKEKAQLMKLVTQNVQAGEIEELLAAEAPSSSGSSSTSSSGGNSSANMSKKERQRAEKAKAALENQDLPSADMLRKQARQMSRNPELVRRANPQFAHMTDAQIREQAREMEKMAADPAMLKTMMEMQKMPTEERSSLQNIQEGIQGTRPRDEAWINETIKTVKAKPEILKMMFKGKINPASGLSEEQVMGFIDYVTTCSDWFLKNAITFVNWCVEVSGPVGEMYKKVDDATLGCARYILLGIVLFILYYLARFFYYILSLVFGFVAFGYRQITNAASAPATQTSGASSGSGAVSESNSPRGKGKGGSEFEF